jgi:hypothetical protein
MGKLLLALASKVMPGSESRGLMTTFYFLTGLGAFKPHEDGPAL